MMVWPLPRVTFRELQTIDEKRPVALLTTESIWAVWGGQITLPVMIQAEPDRYDGDLFEYLATNLPSQVQAIYVVGQGAPLMAGKIIASRNQKPLYIIPTLLDSDMLLTPTALVEETPQDENGSPRWTYQETGPATEVIIDWNVILAGANEGRGAGVVDVLSIITGLLDWRYAAQKGKNQPEQRFAPWAASVAAGLAAQAIKSAPQIGKGSLEGLQTLLNLMMTSVQLSNQLGHTRVLAGSEHYLAQTLRAYVNPDLSQAEIVAPLLLFAAALHGQDPASLRDAMSSAGVRLDQLRATDVSLMLDHLPEHLGTYGFPYSVLNDLDLQNPSVREALAAAGLEVAEDTWMTPSEEVVEEAVEEVDLDDAPQLTEDVDTTAEPTPDPEEDDDVLMPETPAPEQATQMASATALEESQPQEAIPPAEQGMPTEDSAVSDTDAEEAPVESPNG